LQKVDVRLETVSLPHLNGEKMMATSLDFLARGILGEECLNHLREIVERAQ